MLHCACAAIHLASIYSAVRVALLESVGEERRRRKCDKHTGEYEIPDRLHRRPVHIQSQGQGQRHKQIEWCGRNTKSTSNCSWTGGRQEEWLITRSMDVAAIRFVIVQFKCKFLVPKCNKLSYSQTTWRLFERLLKIKSTHTRTVMRGETVFFWLPRRHVPPFCGMVLALFRLHYHRQSRRWCPDCRTEHCIHPRCPLPVSRPSSIWNWFSARGLTAAIRLWPVCLNIENRNLNIFRFVRSCALLTRPLYLKFSNFCRSGRTFVSRAISCLSTATVSWSLKSVIGYSLPFHFTIIDTSFSALIIAATIILLHSFTLTAHYFHTRFLVISRTTQWK